MKLMLNPTSKIKYNSILRDVSIGFSESASYLLVFACAFVASEPTHQSLLIALLIGSLCLAIGSGLIGYLTAKNLIHLQQKGSHILSDENAMHVEVQKKKAFLRNLDMHEEIIELTEQEVRLESEEDAALQFEDTKVEAGVISLRMSFASALGSTIVMLPFLFTDNLLQGLSISAAISLSLIAIALFIKSKLTEVSPIIGTLGNTLVIAIAGACIYFLIRWINM